MSNTERMLDIFAISLVTYLIALALGYGWVRSLGYPLTLRQRKMWATYLIFLSALPVAGPLGVALGLWVMPSGASLTVAGLLMLLWLTAAFRIVRNMSRPGGRFSEDDRIAPHDL